MWGLQVQVEPVELIWVRELSGLVSGLKEDYFAVSLVVGTFGLICQA